MSTTPEKHTKKRETLRNANQHKTTRIAEYEKVYEKPSERKHSELKESDEKLNKTKTLKQKPDRRRPKKKP